MTRAISLTSATPRGTELVIEHTERYWSPTILSPVIFWLRRKHTHPISDGGLLGYVAPSVF